MPVSRKRKNTKRPSRRAFSHSGGKHINREFLALRHLAKMEKEGFERGGVNGRPMEVSAYREEVEQIKRIGTLVQHGLKWAIDFPFHETGVNKHGTKDYALMLELPGDVVAAANDQSDGEPLQAEVMYPLCAGNNWGELYLAVEEHASGGAWWTREVGQRQKVYDLVYRRRFESTGDDEDARDFAIGAADFPFLGLDYFAQWSWAAPDEISHNPAAMKMIFVGICGGEATLIQKMLSEMKLTLPPTLVKNDGSLTWLGGGRA